MATSPKLGLALTSSSESTKKFIDFRTELAGDSPTSNMMILDTEVGKVIDRCNEYDTKPFTWGMLKNGFAPSNPINSRRG